MIARSEYLARLERYRTAEATVQRKLAWAGNTRFALFLLGLVIVWLAFMQRVTSGLWLLVPLVPFAVLSAWTELLNRHSARARAGMSYYERALARIEDRWMGTGITGAEYLTPDHVCAADLDLFGTGSLFERICDCSTHAGRDTLAAWLLNPAAPGVARERQGSVRELRDQLDWRERLSVHGRDLRDGINTRGLGEWGQVPDLPPTRAAAIAPVLVYITLTTAAAVAAGYIGIAPLGLALLVQGCFALAQKSRVQAALAGLERGTHAVGRLSGVVLLIEHARFNDPLLRRLQDELKAEGVPPSQHLRELARLFGRLEDRRNLFFGVIAPFLLWTTRTGLALENWRRRSGEHLERWVGVAGEIEALNAIAGYAYENPDDPYPELVDTGLLFEGRAIGHPLLPRSRCVANDLTLSEERRLLVVSGSNMSGKSTLLRAVGVNAVLAQAGAPVRASSLKLAPLAIGATLRIQDSLMQGKSRFYAEITRLRQIVDLANGPLPVLFLLDEILHGTNSHDRLIGAEGILRGLMKLPAIGMVTTHDLALTAVTQGLAPLAENVHFADEMVNGELHFDYKLHEGPVRHSNAIQLMRAVGLDV